MQDISNAITSSKPKYNERLANKLNNSKTAQKVYYKILKTFVNGTNISLIPLLLAGNQIVPNFLVKANLFNDYFSKQCMIIDNNRSITAKITFENKERLSTFEICSDDIIKIVRSLDPNKARGHN